MPIAREELVFPEPYVNVPYYGQVLTDTNGDKLSSVLVFKDGSIAIYQYIGREEFNKVYPYYNQIGNDYDEFTKASMYDNTYAKNWRFFGPTDAISDYFNSYTALRFDPLLYLNPSVGVVSDGSASFSAANKEYLTIPSNASLQTGNIDFEAGAWVNLASTGNRAIFGKSNGIGWYDWLEWEVLGINGVVRFTVSNGSNTSTSVDATTFGALSLNTWYFVRVWRVASTATINIQINGGAVNSTAGSVVPAINSVPFNIGSFPTDVHYMNGLIDSAYFKKSISTTAEATALYNAGSGRTYADLTADNGLAAFATGLTSWWDLGEESSTRYDSKGTNHLTSAAGQIIAPPVYGSELIVNGGFETAGAGGTDVFGTWVEAANNGAVADETTLVHSGAHAAKLSYVTSFPYIYRTLTLVPEVSYYYYFWTRGDGTNAGTYTIWDATHSSNIVAEGTTGITSTTYALVSGTFTVPAGCTSVQLFLQSSITAGTAYFDDVSVKKIVTASINNGGFDTLGAGGADVFASWTETVAGTSTVNDETAAPYAGAHSARLDVDASASSITLYQTGVVSGRSYKITFWAKCDTAPTKIILDGFIQGTTPIDLTTTYAKYEYTWTATGSGTWGFRRHSSYASRSIFIDSLTLESLGPVGEIGIAEGLAADGYVVSRETDQSGNANHFTQATFSKRPNLASTGIGGKPAVEFDGVDDALVKTGDKIGTGGCTVFAVIKPRGWGASGRIIDNSQFIVNVNGTSNNINVTSNFNDSAVSATNSIALNSSYIVAVTRDTAGLINIYINGTISGTANQSSGTPVAGSDTYTGNRAAFDRAFDGWLGSALIYSSVLTYDQMNNVGNLLSSVYGITWSGLD